MPTQIIFMVSEGHDFVINVLAIKPKPPRALRRL